MQVFDAIFFFIFLIKPKANSPPTLGIVAPPGILKGIGVAEKFTAVIAVEPPLVLNSSQPVAVRLMLTFHGAKTDPIGTRNEKPLVVRCGNVPDTILSALLKVVGAVEVIAKVDNGAVVRVLVPLIAVISCPLEVVVVVKDPLAATPAPE
ncbi:hypothetical protein PCC6912_32220 [Chlorogloeopsis fritschii PCC 6912]|uniref:Uncharacterized protein n=1 Tax=Chlorogloeopsis fritschii PCC 6912 TaxID=211165 RepID=A0A3S0XYA5_CHLFR|nr:hypothetical protein PCC6912_32220 [Chlorogloeopsis fritschii PCC 6912]